MTPKAPEQTLYVILMDVAAEDDEEFDRWNDEEHIPERLSCPGFLRASRYRLAPEGRVRAAGDDSPRPRHLTIYELTGPEALHTPEYAASAASPTEWTKRMAPRLNMLMRECYVLETAAEAPAG